MSSRLTARFGAVAVSAALVIGACGSTDDDGAESDSDTTDAVETTTTESADDTPGEEPADEGGLPVQEVTSPDGELTELLGSVVVDDSPLAAGIGLPQGDDVCVTADDPPQRTAEVLTFARQYLIGIGSQDAQDLLDVLIEIDQAQLSDGRTFEVLAAERLTPETAALVIVTDDLALAEATPDEIAEALLTGDPGTTVGNVDLATELLAEGDESAPTFNEFRTSLLDRGLDPFDFALEPHAVMTLSQSYRFRPGDTPGAPNGDTAELVGDAGGRRVLVIDTGMADQPSPHYDHAGFSFAETEAYVDADGDLIVDAGHGPFVSDLVVEATGGTASVGLVKIDSRIGSGFRYFSEGQLIVTLASVLSHTALAAEVLNLSFGSYGCAGLFVHQNLAAELLPWADENIVVAAAGNDEHNAPLFPAAFDFVVGVGSAQAAQKSCFSNFGPSVDLWADGEEVEALYPMWGQLTDGTATWSGTSFATPLVAALAAVELASGLPPDDVKAALRSPTFDESTTGPTSQFEGKEDVAEPTSPSSQTTC